LRGLMVVVLGLAVYLAVVSLPDRRARFARADREVREDVSSPPRGRGRSGQRDRPSDAIWEGYRLRRGRGGRSGEACPVLGGGPVPSHDRQPLASGCPARATLLG